MAISSIFNRNRGLELTHYSYPVDPNGDGITSTEVVETIQVPNGHWILPYHYKGCRTQAVGIAHANIRTIKASRPGGSITDKYLVHNRPFGFVWIDPKDASPTVTSSRAQHHVAFARQIHNGEIGKTVQVPRLKAYEPGSGDLRQMHRVSRKGEQGWVRLTDLANAANGQFTPAELVLGFWKYSGHRDDVSDEILVDMIITEKSGGLEFPEYTKHSADVNLALLLMDEDCDSIWLTRKFCYIILRLLALGERPQLTPYA